jgi:excisionase family DNA binding protein
MEYPLPLLYSRKLAAQALSLSVRAVDYLIHDSKLKTVRVGSKNLIPQAELVKFAKTGHAAPITGTAE